MLEKWLQTLEQEKQKAINKVREVCSDDKTIDLASEEIDVNCVTVENWLKRMHEEGYKVNDDLSAIEKDYSGYEGYRINYNHINHHLAEIRLVPIHVEKGEFEARAAKWY